MRNEKQSTVTTESKPQPVLHDPFRVSKSKEQCDLSAPTIRKYIRAGLRSYHKGRVHLIYRRDLEEFFKGNASLT